LMNNLKNKKEFQLNKTELSNLQENFLAHSVSEEETLQTIKEVYQEHNFVLDPHSAIGFKALKKLGSLSNNFSYLCLETAHPCKFPDAIVSAIDKEPPMPDFVKKIFSKEESFIVLEGNLEILKSYIEKKASNNSSG